MAYALTPDSAARDARATIVDTSIDPGADDTRICAQVRDMFQVARAARNPLVQLWNRCHRALTPKVNSASGEVSIPEIWPIVRSAVGWKLDQRIVTEVSPAAPLGTEWHAWLAERSRDLEVTLESTAHVNAEEIELEKMLWDGDTYGTGILKTYWEPTLASNMGDAEICRVNPYCIYPDPAGADFDDCDYIIEARVMSLQELDRRFPGKGKLFRRGNSAMDAIDNPPSRIGTTPNAIPRILPNAMSPSTTAAWSRSGQGHTYALTGEPVIVLEAWIREHEINNGQVKDGWRVVMVAGNHVLLNERAEDLWEHNWHPYDRYVDHDLGDFWGIGLVELLGPAQAALNRIVQAVERNIRITGDPILKEERGSTTHGATLAPKPGQRLPVRSGKSVEWMAPPSLHPNIGDLIQFLLDRMKVVSGLNDLPGGGLQGRPAAETAGMLAEAQFISIRSQLINLEHTLASAYRKKAALISEFYTEPRWLPITGPEGEPTVRMLSSRHFMRPTPDGSVPLEFSIRVDAGSASHTSRKVREDKLITLFTLGAIDIMTLLQGLDIPNPQMIVKQLGLQQSSILAANPPGQRQKARA